MTGYVIAINNIGAGYTAIISSFYPAVGAFLAFVFLKERMAPKQFIALLAALAGIIVMGYVSSGESELGNPILGCSVRCCAFWDGDPKSHLRLGMRDDAVDNETALQIRETTSALVYAIAVLPLFGAWGFTAAVVPSLATGVVGAGCFGWNRVVPVLLQEHLVAYRGGEVHGSQYQLFGLGRPVRARVAGNDADADIVVCCVVILAGTVLAASDWNELFGREKAKA